MNKKEFLRFVTKFRVGDRCWEWTAACTGGGYGTIKIKNKQCYAHRLMWKVANSKSIPDNMEICHTCDNPKCVRPDHLFLATHYENMQDRNNKERIGYVSGEESHLSKLTKKDVINIRNSWNNNKTKKTRYGVKTKFCKDMASKYGVCMSNIAHIINNTRWKNINN